MNLNPSKLSKHKFKKEKEKNIALRKKFLFQSQSLHVFPVHYPFSKSFVQLHKLNHSFQTKKNKLS